MLCPLVTTVGFVDIVIHFDRLCIHAAHDAMDMTHNAAHNVVNDRRLRIQQRLQASALKQQHFAICFGNNGSTDLQHIPTDESDDSSQISHLQHVQCHLLTPRCCG